MTDGPKVYNKYHGDAPEGSVYIGRGSPWGNPFKIGPNADRAAVISAHRTWLLKNPELVARVKVELRGKNLICFCKPAACHGDTLLEIANEPDLMDRPYCGF